MPEVGCAGILVADTFCGPMKRLPHEGELLAVDDMLFGAGGCAANVAIGLAKQGITAEVCGCVGADAFADVMLRSLEASGVQCGQVHRLDAYPTSKTVILVVEGQDRRYIHVFGANAGFRVGLIRRDWIDGLKVFYFGGLFATPGIQAEPLAELFQYCRQRGITTVVDVVVSEKSRGLRELGRLLPYVDYFLPNADEAERLTGCRNVEEQAERFLELGAGTAIVSCGSEGALAARGRQRWRASACQVRGIDPSGCGDAFAAGVITGILSRWDLVQTLRYAAALGASATLAVGATAGVFRAAQAHDFLERHEISITAWHRET